MNKYIPYAIITVILISIGQVLFKFSSRELRIDNVYDIVAFFFNKYLILALIIYIFSTALWIFTLSKMELGFSYLLLSLSYPLILILSNIFFGEGISSYKLVSVLLIILANTILLYGDSA